MKRDSDTSKSLIYLFNKGWRVIDGVLFSPDKKDFRGLRTKGKYLYIKKQIGGMYTNVGVHQLVAYQKYGDEIFDETGYDIHVRHLDGNSFNNKEENIAIGTVFDNAQDKPKSLSLRCSIQASSKRRRFTDEEVQAILKDRQGGMTYKQLCEKYNTIKGTLSYFFNSAYYTKDNYYIDYIDVKKYN